MSLKYLELSTYALKLRGSVLAASHYNTILVCTSESEAHHKGVARTHERWPEETGWFGHSVVLTEKPRATRVEHFRWTAEG